MTGGHRDYTDTTLPSWRKARALPRHDLDACVGLLTRTSPQHRGMPSPSAAPWLRRNAQMMIAPSPTSGLRSRRLRSDDRVLPSASRQGHHRASSSASDRPASRSTTKAARSTASTTASSPRVDLRRHRDPATQLGASRPPVRGDVLSGHRSGWGSAASPPGRRSEASGPSPGRTTG